MKLTKIESENWNAKRRRNEYQVYESMNVHAFLDFFDGNFLDLPVWFSLEQEPEFCWCLAG